MLTFWQMMSDEEVAFQTVCRLFWGSSRSLDYREADPYELNIRFVFAGKCLFVKCLWFDVGSFLCSDCFV